jgi:D-3-phosphoglycerate dehydrogenase / 2-oxoglutarate reductase
MIVLIADTFEPRGLEGLQALGCDVRYEPGLADQALADTLRSTGAAVLIVRSTKVTAPMLTPELKLIVRAGSGVNTIDVKAATSHGVVVATCPGRNAIAVAELVMGWLVALDRRIPDNVADLRAGKWNKKTYSKARGLFGATLGLLGAGSVAREVILRAAAFGMPVVLWSRRFNGQDRALSGTEAADLGLDRAAQQTTISLAPSPADVAARADALSVHLALAPQTRQIVNAAVLDRLRPGAFVINTARAEVVDYEALRRAAREKPLRVALDVFAAEPATPTGEFADPIVREPSVYGTHHIGASTDQAQDAIAAETVRIVSEYMKTGRAPNRVNG